MIIARHGFGGHTPYLRLLFAVRYCRERYLVPVSPQRDNHEHFQQEIRRIHLYDDMKASNAKDENVKM
jgi:hypothetical protein